MGDGVLADIVTQLQALSLEKKYKLAEVFKSFNVFVNSRDNEIAGDVVNILENFKTQSFIGRHLRWKLIDRYQVSTEVANYLRSGNTADIALSLKCDWFFSDLADPENFFVNDVPLYSLSTRLKVINKYGLLLKNPAVGDLLYFNFKNRYGTKTALPLLPACSETLIRNELYVIKTTLHPRVVQALFDKHPALIAEHLISLAKSEKHSVKSRVSQFNPILGQLANKDLKKFVELYDKSSDLVCVRLGRRPTKKMIKFEIDRIVSDFNKYKVLFENKKFFSRLSLEQFKLFYTSVFLPSKISEFLELSEWSDCSSKLSFVKPAVRSHVILNTFKEKYGREITSDDVLYKCQLFWIPYFPVEARISWVEKKLSLKEDNIERRAEIIANLPTKLSIPKLKTLIESQSDSNTRTEIARYMVSTMKMNEDASPLADVFAYFVRRFRNELPKFRCTITSEMTHLNEKAYLALDLKDWAPINDFINIIKLNNEALRNKYQLREIFSHQVRAFHEKNGDVDACIRNYLEFELSGMVDFDAEVANLCFDTPSERYCIEWFLKEAPKFEWTHHCNKISFIVHLFYLASRFNQNKLAQDQIVLPDWFIDILRDLLLDSSTKYYIVQDILNGMRFSPHPRLADIPQHQEMSCSLACSMLKTDPPSVASKIFIIMEKALKSGFTSYKPFFKMCRLYDSYGIPAEVVKVCRIALKLEEAEYDLGKDHIFMSPVAQPEAVQVLAVLLEPSDYLALIKPYIPTVYKIVEYTDEIKALYGLQKVVCLPFLEFPNPMDCLLIVRMFAKGDYLKTVVGVLLGLCSKVPEKQILALFKEWVDCPISLRKHFLRLTYRIAPMLESVEIFSNVFKTEKNTSLRLLLFQMSRKVFVEEPVEENFQLLESIICKLTAEDEEALQKLFEVSDIDEGFISKYVELLWRLVDTEWTEVVPNGKERIANVLTGELLSLLDEKLCDKLLEHQMSLTLPNSAPTMFLNFYLVDCQTASLQIARLNKVLSFLQPLIEQQWFQLSFKEGALPVCPARNVISQVVHNITQYCRDKTSFSIQPTSLLIELKSSLLKRIKLEYFLQESISVDLAVKYLKKNQLVLDDAAYNATLVELYESYVKEYGSTIGYSLIKYLSNGPTNLDFAFSLVEKSSHPLIQLISIEILQRIDITEDFQVPIFKKTIDILSKSKDLQIQAALHELLKTHRCSAAGDSYLLAQ